MEETILKTLRYFSFFSYAPSFEEIYSFLSLKTTKKDLKLELKSLVAKGHLIKKIMSLPQIFNFSLSTLNFSVYTLPPHRIFLDKRLTGARITEKKLETVTSFIKALALFPQIRLIGLSGRLAMTNAKRNDDVDLFIITAKNRLFTGRLLAMATAAIFGRKRNRLDENPADKVCLNLFFDEEHLTMPKLKRNLYIAHEILQMKPLVNKEQIYERFLAANRWARAFFPNQKTYLTTSKYHLKYTNYLGNFTEFLLKKLQLYFIDRHKTTEIITEGQLWFFPDDFEKKLKRKALI